MNFTFTNVPYENTNSFSKLVLDYIHQKNLLQPFYTAVPSLENIEKQIQLKSNTSINRTVLVEVLKDAYASLDKLENVDNNINLLSLSNTFTICTAHQPNIFTGHLYFIYKILHAVSLTNTLKQKYPDFNFVPLFYMGSEDADLDELGHINIHQEKIEWQTIQKGAVGRMKIDAAFLDVVQRIEGEFDTYPFGKEIVQAIKKCYTKDKTIQQATLEFVHILLGKYGVVTLIADDRRLKSQMITIFKDEILHQTSHQIVAKTSAVLAQHYTVQAQGRDINLFYLKDDKRERIEKAEENKYLVANTDIVFTKEALLEELSLYPEHFSPNVILRGLFQETILPNIAFIGGGGELAYWLQLKDLFLHYAIPFPILILRNSFLLLTKKQRQDWEKLHLSLQELFEKTILLENKYTKTITTKDIDTIAEKEAIEKLYATLKVNAGAIDKSLERHVDALKTKQINKLHQLDKKLLRAEKRNHKDSLQKLHTIKNNLFPKDNLQERYENIIPLYAKYGTSVFDMILECSSALEQQFGIVTIDA